MTRCSRIRASPARGVPRMPSWRKALAALRPAGRGASRAAFHALEGAITRTAVGAARTSRRLASISAQIGRANQALDEMLRRAGGLNDDIQKISGAARETDTA